MTADQVYGLIDFPLFLILGESLIFSISLEETTFGYELLFVPSLSSLLISLEISVMFL